MIDLPTLQKKANLHYSLSLDLFGSELSANAARVNPNGGAIALGHPLGMSGARLVTTTMRQLHRQRGRYALCTMCTGVGQGIAIIIENLRTAER